MRSVVPAGIPQPGTLIDDGASPRGVSRRTFLSLAAAAGGGLAVAVAIGGPAAAAAAAVPTGSAVRSAPVPDLAVAALPVVFGTPTDVARIRAGWWWSRDTDGTVVAFDRGSGRWRATQQQDWAAVVAAGSAILARWGRPSGRRELMLVSGPDPDSGTVPPTSPDPTAPSTPDPTVPSSPDPSSPDPTSATVSSSPAVTPTPAAGLPAKGSTRTPAATPPTPARSTTETGTARAADSLPNTGFDPTTPVALALAALAAGGGLLVAARERGRRDPARRAAAGQQEPPPE